MPEYRYKLSNFEQPAFHRTVDNVSISLPEGRGSTLRFAASGRGVIAIDMGKNAMTPRFASIYGESKPPNPPSSSGDFASTRWLLQGPSASSRLCDGHTRGEIFTGFDEMFVPAIVAFSATFLDSLLHGC